MDRHAQWRPSHGATGVSLIQISAGADAGCCNAAMDIDRIHPGTLLDLRHLPPPEPLRQIERAMAGLAPRAVLRVHTPMLPRPLLERLEAAGWHYALRLLADGSAIVAIRRPAERPASQ